MSFQILEVQIEQSTNEYRSQLICLHYHEDVIDFFIVIGFVIIVVIVIIIVVVIVIVFRISTFFTARVSSTTG
jgi:hypothetical protein